MVAEDLREYSDAIEDIMATCDLTESCSRQQIQYLWYRQAVETSQRLQVERKGAHATLSQALVDMQRTAKGQAARLDLIRLDFLRLRAQLHIKDLSTIDDDVLTLVRSVLMGCSKMLQDVTVVHTCIKDMNVTNMSASRAQDAADNALRAVQKQADSFCQMSMHTE